MEHSINIKEIREKLGFSQQKLADSLSVPKSRLAKWEERGTIPKKNDYDNVQRFLEEKSSQTYTEIRRNLKNTKEYVVPFYDAGATAGNELTNSDNAITDPIGTISVGHFLSDAEAAIRIYGNSMMSNYPPGCILGISELKERIIQPGEVYIVETEEQRIFKRLFYKDDEPDSDVVLCYSDNTMLFEGGARNGKLAYPPFYIPLKNIRKINVVLGVVKRNINLLIR